MVDDEHRLVGIVDKQDPVRHPIDAESESWWLLGRGEEPIITG
jgi:hypothetical protein